MTQSGSQKRKEKMEEPEWMVSMEVMLAALHHEQVQACSISRVTDELRNPNEAAFKPKEVSIGPLHRRDTRHVQLMEETKWRYTRTFLDRNNPPLGQRLKECGTDIIKLDKVIIASYGGNIGSESGDELAKMMIVDGCFLLELLIKLAHYTGNNYSNDPVLGNERKIVSIVSDITMLENQIPLIVLKKLYRKVFPISNLLIEDDHRVADIVKTAFRFPNRNVNNKGCAHILHFMHLSTVQLDDKEGKPVKQELLRCATRLHAAGIRIRAGETGTTAQTSTIAQTSTTVDQTSTTARTSTNTTAQTSTTDHKLVDWFNFDISFDNSNSELQIPALKIKETTEVTWRNLIAWEQSMIGIRCIYTSYGLFFQGLVCCKHDIELLEEKGVIINEAGKSKQELLNLFRTISKGAEYMDSSYEETCKILNAYGRPLGTIRGLPIVTWHNCRHVSEIIMYYWGNWYKILKRDHMPTVWKRIGVLAAVTLLILSMMQTYYSSKSSGKGN